MVTARFHGNCSSLCYGPYLHSCRAYCSRVKRPTGATRSCSTHACVTRHAGRCSYSRNWNGWPPGSRRTAWPTSRTWSPRRYGSLPIRLKSASSSKNDSEVRMSSISSVLCSMLSGIHEKFRWYSVYYSRLRLTLYSIFHQFRSQFSLFRAYFKRSYLPSPWRYFRFC